MQLKKDHDHDHYHHHHPPYRETWEKCDGPLEGGYSLQVLWS
jgi:hypothetical protein